MLKLKIVFLAFLLSTSLFSQEIYNGPIIDMHIHAYNNPSPMFGQSYTNPLTGIEYKGAKDMETHTKECFERFKKYKIVKAVVSSQFEDWYNKDSSLVLRGRSYPTSIEELRTLHLNNNLDILAETAPNYAGLLPTDSKLTPYFDLAVELNIPMGFHMYPGGPPGGAYIMYPKTRAHQGKPLQLEEILIARPNLRIYIMHAGWPYLDDMKALMYAHPQVYVDLGVISWVLPVKEFHHYLEGLVNAGFGKRIMFGTDQMEWPQTIDQAIKNVNSAAFLTIEQKGDIFYNNAATFLGLSQDEIDKHKN